MCSVDWNAVAAWIGAIATVGLLIVAIVAALYAKRTADSALEALRLESEPVLMASIEPGEPARLEPAADNGARLDIRLQMLQHEDGRLYFAITQHEIPLIRTILISIENVGRSPALNIKVHLEAMPIEPDPALLSPRLR